MAEIDFGSIGKQALEMANTPADAGTPVPSGSGATIENQPVGQQTQVSGQPPSPQSTVGATPDGSGTTPPADQKIFEIDLGNGRVEKLTEAQLKDAYSNGLRQSDYTRKTQELAQQRQQIEQQTAVLQQYAQQYQQLMSNPAMLLQQAQQQLAAQQPQVQIDPNQPLTIGQAQQLFQQVALQSQQQQQFAAQQAQQIVEDRLQVADYAESINSTLNGLYTQYPILKAMPQIEDVIRYEVAKTNPSTIDDALQAFNNVAKDMSDKFEQQFNARQQQANQQRAQLAKTGTEPPGGVAPAQPKPNYFRKDKFDLDWTQMASAAKSL